MPRFIQDKPRAFDRVTGIEQAPVKMIEHFPVRSHGLHHAFEIRLHEIALDFLDAGVDVRIEGIVAETRAHFLRGRQRNHRCSHAFRWPDIGEFGIRPRRKPRLGQRVYLTRTILQCRLAGGFRTGRVGDRRKGFSEKIPPLANWLPLSGDVKPHLPVRIKAVPLDELQPVPRRRQPFCTRLHSVVQRRQQPGEPPLLPHSLVRIKQAPVASARDHEPTLLLIHTARQPKRQRVLQQPVAI